LLLQAQAQANARSPPHGHLHRHLAASRMPSCGLADRAMNSRGFKGSGAGSPHGMACCFVCSFLDEPLDRLAKATSLLQSATGVHRVIKQAVRHARNPSSSPCRAVQAGAQLLTGLAPRARRSTRIVAAIHVSNILGAVLDAAALVATVRAGPCGGRARVALDGVAYAPHLPVDVAAWGVDWCAAPALTLP